MTPIRQIPAGIVEWFWRGRALDEARLATPELGERATLLSQRARDRAEAARLLLTRAEPLELSAEASAAELYRESVYWSLCSSLVESGADPTAGDESLVWDAFDETLLSRAAHGAERVQGLRTCLRRGSFVYFAELAKSEQVASCHELRTLAEALLLEAGDRDRTLGAIYLQRVLRLATLVFVVIGVCAGGVACAVLQQRARELGRDLAAGKAWRASSLLPNSGCQSPEQECAGSANLFFHTAKEQDPWLEIDLGSAARFSTVDIVNRLDCCAERAVPLEIEVSDDQMRWSSVAQRDTAFGSWRAMFKPVRARWVRLTAHGRTLFHLSRVRILP